MREAGTEATKAYLSATRADFLLVSRWTLTEFSSALTLKVRTGTITAAEQTAALVMFRRFAAAGFHGLPCDLLAVGATP